MNVIERESELAGKILLCNVKGNFPKAGEPENEFDFKIGKNRSMYIYIPVSGCYSAKQTQTLIVLRDDAEKETVLDISNEFGLIELAEKHHIILVFPNPLETGWNYNLNHELDDDTEFFKRCFATLGEKEIKMPGFNGMIFYLATSKESSATLTNLSVNSPIDCTGIVITEYPEDYQIPNSNNKLPQYVCLTERNTQAYEYFLKRNHPSKEVKSIEEVRVYENLENSEVKIIDYKDNLTSNKFSLIWNDYLSKVRRWRNSTFGTYQSRPNFHEIGMKSYVETNILNLSDSFSRTWYEYIPHNIKESGVKIPVVFFFHGIGCVPLYGAEQSGWIDIANKENIIVVYPKPTIENRWNVWGDPRLPDDIGFVLSLLNHLKNQYNIDETRIYLSGFSMGSMMVNALAAAYPDIFAAAAPCNAPNLGYFSTVDEMKEMLLSMYPDSSWLKNIEDNSEKHSPIKELVDKKKKQYDFKMPVIQFNGLLDKMWLWTDEDGEWQRTFNFWKKYNDIELTQFQKDNTFESMLKGHRNYEEGDDKRFIHHEWYSNKYVETSLYDLVFVKELPHAMDLRQANISWEFMKKFERNSNGELLIKKV